MRTIQLQAFKFNELKPDIQKRVLNKYRDINLYDDWYELNLYDLEQTIEEKLNLKIPKNKVYFEIYSKGSHAKIDSKTIDSALCSKYPTLIDSHLSDFFGICCGYTSMFKRDFDCDIELSQEFSDSDGIEKETEIIVNEQTKKDIEKDLNELQEILLKFYKGLYEEHDYRTSDEAIIETFEANEYEFLEDGKVA